MCVRAALTASMVGGSRVTCCLTVVLATIPVRAPACPPMALNNCPCARLLLDMLLAAGNLALEQADGTTAAAAL